MSFFTPLRYPGGKGRMGPWLAEVMRHNRISGGWYVEPYAGGAGAAIFLLAHGYVDHIVINDADPAIFSFWKAVTEQNSDLVSKIKKTRITMNAWLDQKEVLANPGSFSQLDIAFAAFFLNRTNRSGILSGGVIGGLDQTGKWKLNARFNKDDLIERIQRIGRLAGNITVYGEDALILIDTLEGSLPAKSLIYMDPPYYVKGSQLYRNFYDPSDHEAIAERVKKLKTPVLITYDNAEEISALYKDVDQMEFSFHYSTHLARPTAKELMFFKNMTLPSAPQMTRRTQLVPTSPNKAPNIVPKIVHKLAV